MVEQPPNRVEGSIPWLVGFRVYGLRLGFKVRV